MVGAKTNLLTSRWSPMSRLFSIEPVGILKACTMKVRTKSARMTATQIDSKYSRAVDFLYGTACPEPGRGVSLMIRCPP
jgi:hypothetical protein